MHHFKTILKFLFAAAIIVFLIRSDKLDFTLLQKVFDYPVQIFAGLGGLLSILALTCFRLKKLLEYQTKEPINFFPLFYYHYIGIFFSAVLPGIVSGDVIKIFYVEKLSEKLNKKNVIGLLLVDRIMGLFGLLFLLGCVTVISFSSLSQIDQMSSTLYLNLLLLLGVLSFFFLLYKFDHIFNLIKKYPSLSFLMNLEPLWVKLCSLRSFFLRYSLFSIIVHFLAVFTFWCLTYPFAEGGILSLELAATTAPLGFISIALPISPSGAGLGHLIFDKLLMSGGVSNGASLFNIYFCFNLVINLLGVIPYLALSSSKKLK